MIELKALRHLFTVINSFFFSCSQIVLLKNCPTKSPSALKKMFLYDGIKENKRNTYSTTRETAFKKIKTIHRARQKTDERTLLCDLTIDTRWPLLQWTIDAKKLFLRILLAAAGSKRMMANINQCQSKPRHRSKRPWTWYVNLTEAMVVGREEEEEKMGVDRKE